MTDISESLKEHVTLDVERTDRAYISGQTSKLQMSGQLVEFMHH